MMWGYPYFRKPPYSYKSIYNSNSAKILSCTWRGDPPSADLRVGMWWGRFLSWGSPRNSAGVSGIACWEMPYKWTLKAWTWRITELDGWAIPYDPRKSVATWGFWSPISSADVRRKCTSPKPFCESLPPHIRYPGTRLWFGSVHCLGPYKQHPQAASCVFPWNPQPVRQKLPATTCSNWLIGQLGVGALVFLETWLCWRCYAFSPLDIH